MPATYETAYPRLKHSVSEKELQEFYTPSADELALAAVAGKGTARKIVNLRQKGVQPLMSGHIM